MKAPAPKLQVEDFLGCVIFKDWMHCPDGQQYIGVIGKVSILRDQEAVGFKSEGNNNANWIARIEGPTTTLNILGCQVVGAWTLPDAKTANKNWMVLP